MNDCVCFFFKWIWYLQWHILEAEKCHVNRKERGGGGGGGGGSI